MKSNFYRCALSFFLLFGFTIFHVNAQNKLEDADRYVRTHLKNYKLTDSDIEDWIVTNNYVSKHNGVNHIYYQQTINGIPVEGAIMNVNVLKSGKVISANSRFISHVHEKAISIKNISQEEALSKSLQDLKISVPRDLQIKTQLKNNRQEVVFTKWPEIEKDISVQLVYVYEEGEVILAWVSEILSLEPQFNAWSIYIDANSGKILKKVNAVLECNFGDHDHSFHDVCKVPRKQNDAQFSNENTSGFLGGEYRVFDSPVESPNHGSRSLITDPSDPIASPYGWHDTNGANGAEYTITRGNNVHAQDDINGNNGSGYSPDGGANLTFDFTLDFNESANNNTPAAQNLNSALTNLFYWNNIIHDVFYQYGFDEASGNFQENNYGRGGIGGDYVFADGLDGSDSNNARFYTSPDGTNGRMEMYLWDGGGAVTNLEVNSPGNISGQYINTAAQFGATTYNVTGDLVIVDDGAANPSEGCNALTNAAAINGNIAVIDRGNCQFGTKALNAENAGAIAVIVCNNVAGSPTTMSAGNDGAAVTIPVIMISQSDCATIKLELPSVNVTMTGTANPSQFDGSYDNGIIAHEYGHGISTRLTGGAATNACLTNAEQGGEGWSDFFGLVLTHELGDDRNTSRGIGTYVFGQSIFGGGIRTYPYTTDMNINPSTYDDIKTFVAPHGVGSVLCTMLWDLYWDLTDKYGYNADLNNTTSGNGIAIQLVMDGLKLQPCNPGFVDVRDAILLADEINYGGANRCLIWNAFARRGLGVSADQGDPASKTDGTEAFDVPSDLIIDSEINITEAFEGEIFTINSDATCGCAPKTGVQYKHTIPAGLTVLSVEDGSIVGNEILSNTVDLEASEKVSIKYTARIDLCNPFLNVELLNDDIEGADKFTSSTLDFSGNWVKSNTEFFSPSNSWYAQNFAVSSDYALTSNSGIALNGPAELSFYHRFETEESWDGGIVEISTNGGSTWQVLDNEFIQNGYQSTFSGISPHDLAGLNAFTGSSDIQFSTSGFVQSIVDLSSFEGETILIRFRFASDTNTSGGGLNGWYIDNVEITQVPALTVLSNLISSIGNENDDSYLIEIKDLDQEAVYVDKTTTGKRYGNKWDNAFASVQDALKVAACNESVNEIWVKADTYYPTESTDQSIAFELSDDVTIYGGFAGNESDINQRDPVNNPTILSGDIGVPGDMTDNSFNVVVGNDISSTAHIEGFIIQRGNAADNAGGGLKFLNANVNVTNCILMNNLSLNAGGAVTVGLNANVNFKNCTFQNNNAVSGEGRAIGVSGSAQVLLEDCEIIDAAIGSSGSTINNSGNAVINSKGLVEIKKSN